jgi:hypothetical protein
VGSKLNKSRVSTPLTCERSSCERLVEIKMTVSCNVTSSKVKWAMASRLVFCYLLHTASGIGQSPQILAVGGMVRGSNPCDGEIFRAVQTGPEAHAASCKMGTGSFLGAKRPERGADHPLPSSTGLHMSWSYTSTSPLRPHSHVMRWPLPMFHTHTLQQQQELCLSFMPSKYGGVHNINKTFTANWTSLTSISKRYKGMQYSMSRKCVAKDAPHESKY